jgi:hypothetical protein
VNFINAYWLSCLAANQYYHYSVFRRDLVENLDFKGSQDSELSTLISEQQMYIRKLQVENQDLWKFLEEKKFEKSALDIVLNRDEVKMDEDDIPKGYFEARAHLAFYTDSIVRRKVPRASKDSRTIDFYSTKVDDPEGSFTKDSVIQMLVDNGMESFQRFKSVSDQELNDKYDSIRIGGTQVVWAEHDDFIVISVRGTEPGQIEDMVTDMMAYQLMFDIDERKSENPKSYTAFLHTGFNAAFAEVMEKFLTRKLFNLRSNNKKAGTIPKPLYITGHSLGGAIATLIGSRIIMDNFREWIKANPNSIDGKPTKEAYAKRLMRSHSYELRPNETSSQFCSNFLSQDGMPKNISDLENEAKAKLKDGKRTNYIPVKGFYTYGSPRVGDGTFKKVIECLSSVTDTTIARFRNNNDIVPTVSHFNNYAVMPYMHIGKQIVFAQTPNSAGKRMAHFDTSNLTAVERSRLAGANAQDMSGFFTGFADKGNYVERFGGVCEPGTKCWAYGNPFYHIYLADDFRDVPSSTPNLASLATKVFWNRDSIAAAGKDHLISVPGSLGYLENLKAMYPADGTDVKCSDYDFENVPNQVNDVVLTDQIRTGLVDKLLGFIGSLKLGDSKKEADQFQSHLEKIKKEHKNKIKAD